MEWIRIIPSSTVGITFPPLKDFYPIHSYPQPVREGPRVATVGPLVPTPQSTFQTKLPYKTTSTDQVTVDLSTIYPLPSFPPFPDPLFTRFQRVSRPAVWITESVCHSLEDRLCTLILRQSPAESTVAIVCLRRNGEYPRSTLCGILLRTPACEDRSRGLAYKQTLCVISLAVATIHILVATVHASAGVCNPP